jgi:hypothetical protein
VVETILHHDPAAPFAEKIRAILGYKGLAWRSVVIPVIMPKPVSGAGPRPSCCRSRPEDAA